LNLFMSPFQRVRSISRWRSRWWSKWSIWKCGRKPTLAH